MSLKDLDLNSRLCLCEISKTSVPIFSEISKPVWIKFCHNVGVLKLKLKLFYMIGMQGRELYQAE